MEKPLVTVLLPTYNSSLYVKEAIDSIINQTYKNIEIIIIDDGSTDGTQRVISNFSDERIKYFENESNIGLIKTLNLGFDMAQGVYIARMDNDDIALPFRLERQVEFLNKNKNISVVGSDYAIIGSSEIVKNSRTNEEIKCKFIYHNPIAHPAVMLRREYFNSLGLRYDNDYPSAEDYELWTRASLSGAEFYNMDEVLLQYRRHSTQISNARRKEQLKSEYKIKKKYLSGILNHNFSDTELDLLIGNPYNADYKFSTLLKTFDMGLSIAHKTRSINAGMFSKELKKIALETSVKLKPSFRSLIHAAGNPAIYRIFTIREILFLIRASIFSKQSNILTSQT